MGLRKPEQLKKEKGITEVPTKKEINDLRKQCSFCSKEAVYVGAFKNEWFNLTVLMCDVHLKGLLDRNVELEKLQYELPIFPEEEEVVAEGDEVQEEEVTEE